MIDEPHRAERLRGHNYISDEPHRAERLRGHSYIDHNYISDEPHRAERLRGDSRRLEHRVLAGRPAGERATTSHRLALLHHRPVLLKAFGRLGAAVYHEVVQVGGVIDDDFGADEIALAAALAALAEVGDPSDVDMRRPCRRDEIAVDRELFGELRLAENPR